MKRRALILLVLILSMALIGPNLAAAAGRSHTVQYGETLTSIAAQYGVSVDSLAAANGTLIAPAGTMVTAFRPSATVGAAPVNTSPPSISGAQRAEPLHPLERRVLRVEDELAEVARRVGVTAIAHSVEQCRPPRPSARTAASAAGCWQMSRTGGSSVSAETA